MPELLEELRDAFADRYTIERELGRGGMAVVFLARDLKHHRSVAIKVLRPAVAAALGPERFLREMEISARLQHPHILSLHDSGEAAGLLYYVMPYVEGESLRDRLTRERQLPVDDALRIGTQVAGALEYAHSHDIVHRDIKPENILLAGDEAVVADFGIARAITAAGGEQLTTTGIAVGTPAYMSPEQAAGEAVDGRTDVYSLACVLYELLTGEPPYTGPTAQAIQARRLADPVRPLRTVREAVPVHVERAIVKALAKVPADRFATATQFAEAFGAAEPRSRRPLRRMTWAGAATAALAVGVWAAGWSWSRRSVALDPNLVAVLPFRVTGADSLYREVMVDLLAAKLTGEGGPRGASPQSVISGWRRAARSQSAEPSQESVLRLARGLGAGRLLLGSVVGTPGRLIISASLLGAGNGREEARARVEGPPDSLLDLVDQLTSQLLIAGAGVTPSLASLTSTSLPALQAYLNGRAAYRRGRFKEAARAFDRALASDSTFALAALALQETAGWGAGGSCVDNDRCMRLAWQSRARLALPERAMLTAYAGPRYPAPSSGAEFLAAREELARLAPDRPEPWFLLGDQLYHWGTFLGVEDSRHRAAAAFRRALELDSAAYVTPLWHLAEISAEDGDTVGARLYVAQVQAADSLGEPAEWVRRFVALKLRDSAELATERARMDKMTSQVLGNIIMEQVFTGDAPQDARRALALLSARASTARDRGILLRDEGIIAFDAGRPTEARAALEKYRALHISDEGPWINSRLPEHWIVLGGLYWDGNDSAATAAAGRLAAHADAPAAASTAKRDLQHKDICVLEQWRLWHRQTATAQRSIEHLRSAAPPDDRLETLAWSHTCAALLEAMLATVQRRLVARLLDRLDSLMQTGPPGVRHNYALRSANLVVARLREAQGDLPRALAAVKRGSGPTTMPPPLFLTSYLREEGRLAALNGDTAGAIRAYSQYLRFRYDPEPALGPEVDRVRAELSRLVGEGR